MMIDSSVVNASCYQYELEIAISASRERVWKAIIGETNFWWLPDFHVAGEGSTMTFDTSPGGRGLVEETAGGGGLQWYAVQMFLPGQYQIYLVGHIAPDWGGPTTSNLKIALEETDGTCVLKVTDARHGNIDDAHVQSYEDGWKQLFTGGLKQYVESAN